VTIAEVIAEMLCTILAVVGGITMIFLVWSWYAW
jgi:hypothetical protein